jgi:hypothetical protein
MRCFLGPDVGESRGSPVVSLLLQQHGFEPARREPRHETLRHHRLPDIEPLDELHAPLAQHVERRKDHVAGERVFAGFLQREPLEDTLHDDEVRHHAVIRRGVVNLDGLEQHLVDRIGEVLDVLPFRVLVQRLVTGLKDFGIIHAARDEVALKSHWILLHELRYVVVVSCIRHNCCS